jgi:ATP-dependent DNA helicase DinG
VDAPTGTGKTWSYLTPAIRWATEQPGRRIVVATANILLQEQLLEKDLPELARRLPWPFRTALLKGKAHYLCRARYAEFGEKVDRFADEGERDEAISVFEWARGTQFGDRATMPRPVSDATWARFSVDADDCVGARCPQYEQCGARLARGMAASAHVIVVNYHLLFAHLAFGGLLPGFNALVCDEAHGLPDVARQFFGYRLTEGGVERLVGRLRALAAVLPDTPGVVTMRARARAVAVELSAAGAALFAELHALAAPRRPAGGGPCVLRVPVPPVLAATGPFLEQVRRAGRVGAWAGERASETVHRGRGALIERNAGGLERITTALLGAPNPNLVYWIGYGKTPSPRFEARPLDVGRLLRERLFSEYPRTILCSATLPDAEALRSEFGLPPDAEALSVPSPFDTRARALGVVPASMPVYKHDERATYQRVAAEAIRDVVRQARGRTLVLCARMDAVAPYAAALEGCGYRVLRQGDGPRGEIARQFREDVSSVLIATASFRTGLDVPGESLSCVVIDRIPFSPPDDPIFATLVERLGRAEAMRRYSMPRAMVEVRQGVGRLLRTATDRGVVVILDRRINRGALMPMRWTGDVAEIGRFLDGGAL